MKKPVKLIALALALLTLLCACGSEKAPGKAASGAAFTPKLDTQKAVELECAVNFGNFEAFDQVINHFNAFYPNVKITYYQAFSHVDDFIKNNSNVDIFMTSTDRGYPEDDCADLTAAGVDVSDIADGLLASYTVDGKVLCIPMGLQIKGLVVNQTLLEKEGLSVPETWPDFLNALEVLKQKGYTPIQGPNSAVSSLFYNMGMAMVSTDKDLYNAIVKGDAAGASGIRVVFERMKTLLDKGYTDPELNTTYPDNNYEDAILKFFQGDVPFWVCDTEKVSGMKKRETKSEAFTANPFSYTFVFAPTGDTGVYKYVAPWYGFAVYKGSQDYDYAVEFLRFLAQADELNTLASVKGIPSVAKLSSDTRYTSLNSVAHVEKSVADDGTVPSFVGRCLEGTENALLTGTVQSVDEALDNFLENCAWSIGESN